MSTYYGIKLKDVVLDVTNNSKILEWITACQTIRNKSLTEKTKMNLIKNTLPNKLSHLLESENWLIELASYLYNEKDEFGIELDTSSKGKKLCILNFTVSYKNNTGCTLQQFIILIKDLILSGDIYLCVDGRVSKINYREKFTCDLFIDGGLKVNFPVYDVKMMSDDAYEDMQYEFKIK